MEFQKYSSDKITPQHLSADTQWRWWKWSTFEHRFRALLYVELMFVKFIFSSFFLCSSVLFISASEQIVHFLSLFIFAFFSSILSSILSPILAHLSIDQSSTSRAPPQFFQCKYTSSCLPLCCRPFCTPPHYIPPPFLLSFLQHLLVCICHCWPSFATCQVPFSVSHRDLKSPLHTYRLV